MTNKLGWFLLTAIVLPFQLAFAQTGLPNNSGSFPTTPSSVVQSLAGLNSAGNTLTSIPAILTALGVGSAGLQDASTFYPSANPSKFISASQAPLQSVAGLIGSPTVAQLLAALGIGSAGLQPSSAFYSASNPNGFINSSQAPLQSVAGLQGSPTVSQLLTALGIGSAGLQPSSAFYPSGNPSGFITAAQAPLQSVAGLMGNPTVAQLLSALGVGSAGLQDASVFYPASNPTGFITTAQAPVQSVAGLTGSPTVGQILTALGIGSAGLQPASTFYPASNPTGFITAAQAPLQSIAGLAGNPTVSQLLTALGIGSAGLQPASAFATPAQVTAAAIQVPGGPFTVTTSTNPLPPCGTAYLGKVAFVSDLGGGPDNVSCRGSAAAGYYWAHLRLGTPQSYTGTCSGTITVTPLTSAAIQDFTGCTNIASGFLINVSGTSTLYPGEEFYFIMPSSLGGIVTSVGVSLSNVPTGIALLAGSRSHVTTTSALKLLQLQPQ